MRRIGEISPLLPSTPVPRRGEGGAERRGESDAGSEQDAGRERSPDSRRGDPDRGAIIDDYV